MITEKQRSKAEANGISKNTLRARLRKGWSIEQAINIPVNSHLFFQDDEIKRAAENGITRRTLYNRIAMYGWDIEKAINTPLIPRNQRSHRKYEKKRKGE